MDFLLGLAIGYVSISICESLSHRLIGHAPPLLKRWVGKIPFIGWYFVRSWFGHHIVHHRLTYRHDFSVQFSRDEERRRVDTILIRKNYTNMFRARYGLGVGNFFDVLLFIAPTSVVFAAEFLLTTGWLAFGIVIPIILMPIASNCIHPYIHLKEQDRERLKSPILQILFNSKYFKYITIRHWIHHRYGDCNYNLIPLGDYLLFVHRGPSEFDLRKMGEDKISAGPFNAT